MRKGIIFEIENGKATVIKNNGDFVSVSAHPDWKKGDVVTIQARNITFKPFSVIAACFLVFISVSAFGGKLYFDETALVSLDVNPSIELSVNRFDRVIAARSLNEDGRDILEQVHVKNKSLDNAVSALFDGGVGEFISQNPLVTFTVFSPDTQNEQLIRNKLQKTADTYVLSHHANAQVEVLSVGENVVNEAHEYNVTAGKYTALQELKEVLPDMEMKNYSHHSISYIKEQTKFHGAGHGKPDASERNRSTPEGGHNRGEGHNRSHE